MTLADHCEYVWDCMTLDVKEISMEVLVHDIGRERNIYGGACFQLKSSDFLANEASGFDEGPIIAQGRR